MYWCSRKRVLKRLKYSETIGIYILIFFDKTNGNITAATARSSLNLPIFGWFSSFIIRTSLKSCWDKEEHLMHLEICWMTSHAMTLSVGSVSAGKALLESVIMHWAVYIWNWITLCSNMRGAEGHGATVLCKAISVMQRQPRAKPWPTQIRTRITTPLTHCSPASRPSKHPSQQHHTAAHCGVTAHRLAAS